MRRDSSTSRQRSETLVLHKVILLFSGSYRGVGGERPSVFGARFTPEQVAAGTSRCPDSRQPSKPVKANVVEIATRDGRPTDTDPAGVGNHRWNCTVSGDRRSKGRAFLIPACL